jgi:hypothetical protein
MTTTTATHLIRTDLIQTSPSQLLVRFALPSEKIEAMPYTKALNDFDVQRRRDFLTRKYITEKLCAWLRQRGHSLPAYRKAAESLLNWLEFYKMTSLDNIVSFVIRYRNALNALAPDVRSRFYNHFENTIAPILRYCDETRSA